MLQVLPTPQKSRGVAQCLDCLCAVWCTPSERGGGSARRVAAQSHQGLTALFFLLQVLQVAHHRARDWRALALTQVQLLPLLAGAHAHEMFFSALAKTFPALDHSPAPRLASARCLWPHLASTHTLLTVSRRRNHGAEEDDLEEGTGEEGAGKGTGGKGG